MKYETVAEAYRDLEAATGRLALIDRLAELIRATPDEELARVCYLCQGLSRRSSPGSTSAWPRRWRSGRSAGRGRRRAGRVTAAVRETGDLGEAAEALLAGPRRPA